jgi:hypothetical protein
MLKDNLFNVELYVTVKNSLKIVKQMEIYYKKIGLALRCAEFFMSLG